MSLNLIKRKKDKFLSSFSHSLDDFLLLLLNILAVIMSGPPDHISISVEVVSSELGGETEWRGCY